MRIYTGEGVATELEKAKLEYLQASVVVTLAKRVILPELLVKHAVHFVAREDGNGVEMGSLVKWVCNQLPTSGSLRKSMVDCLKNQNSKASSSSSSLVVEKIPYDFEFQYLLAIWKILICYFLLLEILCSIKVSKLVLFYFYGWLLYWHVYGLTRSVNILWSSSNCKKKNIALEIFFSFSF